MEKSSMTMEMIAEKCGVSKMTVSRVLNPRFSGKILPETREKILKVVKKYNYQSNQSASRLKRKKLDTITLLMGLRATKGPSATPDFDLHYEMISWGIVKGVVQEARKHNYDTKIEPLLSNETCDEIIHNLVPRLTDGVILCSSSAYPEKIITHLEKTKMPNVTMEYSETSVLRNGINYVMVNRKPGLLEAIEHLYKKGHRKIGFIGSDLQISSQEQKQIYSGYLIEKGIYNEKFFYSVNTFLELKILLTGFKSKSPFTALLCHNDSLADLTVKELCFMGVKIPENIAIIGFDGNPVYQGTGQTNISTIYVPHTEISRITTQMLIKNINSETFITDSKEILKTYFMPGTTT